VGRISFGNGLRLRGRSGGVLVGIREETFNIHENEAYDHFLKILVTHNKSNFKWNLIIV
jgi:hypothetical protein